MANGTQQAVSLLSRLLLDEGDHVIMEEPRYERAAACMSVHGAKVHCLPVDEEGLICDGMERLSPRLAFVTPAHQFPSGVQMSQARRSKLLKLARQHQFWIVEDDYDGEFDLDRNTSPALKAADSEGVVIYVGTFSKTIFPAIRLGYVVAPPSLRQDLVSSKVLADLESSGLDQLALAHFMRSGAFERHLRKVSAELRRRRRALEEGLLEQCGPRVRISGRPSGMHCVAWFPGLQAADLERLIQRAAERDVGLRSIAPHYQRSPPAQGLLLGFSRSSTGQLKAATRIIGECLREVIPTELTGEADSGTM